MDPGTAISLAKFAYDTLNRPQNPGNPFDSIIEMLTSINEELVVINKKADLILSKLEQLDEKVEFQASYNVLKSAFKKCESIFADFKSDINDLGEEQGKEKFKNDYSDLVKDYLKDIWDASTIVMQLHDPISSNYICLVSQMDYELSMLIDWDNDYLKNQHRQYLTYYKEQISDNENMLKTRFEKIKSKIIGILELVHYEKKIINYKHVRKHVNAPFPPRDSQDIFFLKFKPIIEIKEITNQEKEYYNFLFMEGYIDSADVNLIKPNLKNTDATEYNANANPENSCVSSKTLTTEYTGLTQKRTFTSIGQNCNNKPQIINLQQTLANEYEKLIIYGMALINIDFAINLTRRIVEE